MGKSLFARILNCWSTASCFLTENASASSNARQLGYSTYVGTSLENGITQWLGMRYAAPPLGELRFAAPQDPVHEQYIQAANKHGTVCLATLTPQKAGYGEDCLFLDVFAPTSATSKSLLPVYFFIQGGGFLANTQSNFNASELIKQADMQMVVVTFNYRAGPYGFLASKEVAQKASLNNGLKDQYKALEWVQKHISKFGGNPGHVVLGGVSAGGGSAAVMLTAHEGRDDGLFHGAAIESATFSPILTPRQSQQQYEDLVDLVGCASSNDTLACLRDTGTAQLQGEDLGISVARRYLGAFKYGPTLDGDIVTDYTYNLFAQGKYIRVPTIWGDDKNGGTLFTHTYVSTEIESRAALQKQWEFMTDEMADRFMELYPPDNFPRYAGTGKYYRSTAKAMGDIWFMCPELHVSDIMAQDASVPVWNYYWNVSDPAVEATGLGVYHLEEVPAVWGVDNVGTNYVPPSFFPGRINADIVPITQRYWTSFIRSFNPNRYRKQGAPVWTRWTATSKERLVFVTNDTHMAPVPYVGRTRCAYINSIGPSLRQ